MARLTKIRQQLGRLRADTSGLAMIEFAYAMPLLVGLAGYGLELSNLANANMKVSQAANALADNMSRVGLESGLSLTQLREADINDGFIGILRQTSGINLTQNGRVILSSLEQNSGGGQWIHWQRCIGAKNYPSTYGNAGDGASGSGFQGMGPATARVTAPAAGTAVMFVEITYDYQPLFSSMFFGAKQIHYYASFIVRDDRDLVGPGNNGVYNPSPTAPSYTCNLFSAS
jgi:hypothetical protein